MKTNKEALPSAHTLRAISVRAYCDPKTTAKALLGRPVRELVLVRIRKAVMELAPTLAPRLPESGT